MADMGERLAVLESRAEQQEFTEREQWQLLEKIRDRLPNWAVWAMTISGGIIGALVSWLVSCLK